MHTASVDRVTFAEISLAARVRKCEDRSPVAVALGMQCGVVPGATCTCNLKQGYRNDSQLRRDATDRHN